MAKISLKQLRLRKGADKRALMKNKDGSPIHYDQQDQNPVFEAELPGLTYHRWHGMQKATSPAPSNTFHITPEDHMERAKYHEKKSEELKKKGWTSPAAAHSFAAHAHREAAAGRGDSDSADDHSVHAQNMEQTAALHKEEFVAEETVPHTDIKAWRRHAKAVGGYVEDHGTHLEAWDEKHKKIGHFHPEAGHGYIHDERPMFLKRQAEAVESLDQLYPIFEEAGLFEANGTIDPKHAYGAKEHLQLNKMASQIIKKKEAKKPSQPEPYGVHEHLSHARKEEARSKAEYETHLAQAAAHAHVPKSTQIHARRAHRYLKLVTKEETLIEAGSSKSSMKRKYLGKSKGRTEVGTKAHPIDVKPKITFKDPGAIGRAGTMKMPQPTAAKGL